MDAPGPYRKEPELKNLIAPDRRPLMAALVGAVIGALVGSTVTLALVRDRSSGAAAAVPTSAVITASPPTPVATVATAPTAAPCTFDMSSGVVVTRDPLPDLARFPGAVVRKSIGDMKTNTASVMLETCAPFSDVLAFYREGRGLVLDGEVSGDPHQLTFTKDDPANPHIQSFSVGLQRVGGGTRIYLGSGMPRLRTSERGPKTAW